MAFIKNCQIGNSHVAGNGDRRLHFENAETDFHKKPQAHTQNYGILKLHHHVIASQQDVHLIVGSLPCRLSGGLVTHSSPMNICSNEKPLPFNDCCPLFKETNQHLLIVLCIANHKLTECHTKHKFTQNLKIASHWSVIHKRKWFFVSADIIRGGTCDA